MMWATEVIEVSQDGTVWWLGFIVGGLVVGTIVAVLFAMRQAAREQDVYEQGHAHGWDAAVKAAREGRII